MKVLLLGARFAYLIIPFNDFTQTPQYKSALAAGLETDYLKPEADSACVCRWQDAPYLSV